MNSLSFSSMNTTNLHIPSNKACDIERYMHSELASLYPETEIRQFARMLFEAFVGWDTARYLLHRNDTINQSDLLKFHWAVEDLRRFRPIQHIIGYTYFGDCKIEVNENVLIPRPETEEITNKIIQTQTFAPGNILDICTGSGCIAIALSKQYPYAETHAADISPEALILAKRNAIKNNTEIQFHQCDVLAEDPWESYSFDLIVSNPPYIRQSESAEMHANVLDYEPHLALFVEDDDPLVFYRRIGEIAKHSLSPDGRLVLEINETLGNETCSLLNGQGFETELHQDFRGKDRMVIATR